MIKKVRKRTVLFLVLCLLLVLCACGKSKVQEEKDTDARQTKSDTEETKSHTKDTLVVYFSATGTTKRVAEKIADIADADLYEIVPAETYSPEDLKYNDSDSRTSVEMNDPDARPDIGSEKLSLDGYETLYIGYAGGIIGLN